MKIKFLSAWTILFRKVPIFVISAKNGFQAAPRKTSDVLVCFFEAPEIPFFQKTYGLRQFEAPKRSKKSRKNQMILKFLKITITSDFDLRLYREWMIWKKRYGGNRLRAVSGGVKFLSKSIIRNNDPTFENLNRRVLDRSATTLGSQLLKTSIDVS